MQKLFRITTVPISLKILLKGQLRFMSQYYDVTAISDKEGLIEVEKQENVKIFDVELTRKITLFKDFKALFRLYRFFRKEKPFIVHTHTPKAGLIGMVAAFLARVPHRLHTVAGMPLMETTGFKRKILNLTEKTTCFCANKVYPNSKGLYDFILNNKFCPQKKLKVIASGSSNGIDTQYFNPDLFSSEDKQNLRKQLNISENDIVFVFVGRLVKDKGINELITSFSQLIAHSSNLKLLLVGPFERELDPLLPKTEKLIIENTNILSVGFQSDVRPYLAISDIFVFPSYREGFPNVVMQAGAMGLPSIVTDINGCNEIIEDGVNGLIISPKNAEMLSEKMLLLLNNSDLRNKLKSQARGMTVLRYEQKIVWEALLKEYESLEK
jgi:glycosyltransferase involved in cell wall biosynthesis